MGLLYFVGGATLFNFVGGATLFKDSPEHTGACTLEQCWMREDTPERTGAVLNTRGSHWSGAEYTTGNWSEGRGARRDLQGYRIYTVLQAIIQCNAPWNPKKQDLKGILLLYRVQAL